MYNNWKNDRIIQSVLSWVSRDIIMGMCDNNEVMMNYDEKFSNTITNILMKKTENP